MGRAISWPASRSEIMECITKDSGVKSFTETLNENFSTFKNWADGDKTTKQGSLLKRFLSNFETFRDWQSK